MKFLCILFSVYVLLLSVKPCCADNCDAEPLAKKESAEKNAKPEADCHGCSPFFSCGTCVGFPLTNRVISVENAAREIKPEHYSYYKQPALKAIVLSIWQPPQLG